MRRIRGLAPAALLVLALGGCSSIGDIAGAISGTAATAGSANPAVGIAVGVATRAVTSWGIRTVSRRWQRTEQEAIAAAIGATAVGDARPWQVRHDLPIGNNRGEVQVLRAIDTPLATCREALFSLVSGSGAAERREWYLGLACRQEGGWRWAVAEPATERWGSLH
jgi:hypothetical protein